MINISSRLAGLRFQTVPSTIDTKFSLFCTDGVCVALNSLFGGEELVAKDAEVFGRWNRVLGVLPATQLK